MPKQYSLSIHYFICWFGIALTIFFVLLFDSIDKYAVTHWKDSEITSLEWHRIHYNKLDIMPTILLLNSP